MPFLSKKNLIILILIVLCNVSGYTQTSKSDSLIKVLQSQKEDTNAVKTIHLICIAYLEENNPQGSLDYAKKGIAMAEKLKLGRQKINQYYHAGKACIMLSQYDEAFEYLDYAIKNGKEFKKLYPQCL